MAAIGSPLQIMANQALFSLLGIHLRRRRNNHLRPVPNPWRPQAPTRNHVRDLRYGRVPHDALSQRLRLRRDGDDVLTRIASVARPDRKHRGSVFGLGPLSLSEDTFTVSNTSGHFRPSNRIRPPATPFGRRTARRTAGGRSPDRDPGEGRTIPRPSRGRHQPWVTAEGRTPSLSSTFLPHRAVDNRLIYVRNVEVVGSSPITSTQKCCSEPIFGSGQSWSLRSAVSFRVLRTLKSDAQ